MKLNLGLSIEFDETDTSTDLFVQAILNLTEFLQTASKSKELIIKEHSLQTSATDQLISISLNSDVEITDPKPPVQLNDSETQTDIIEPPSAEQNWKGHPAPVHVSLEEPFPINTNTKIDLNDYARLTPSKLLTDEPVESVEDLFPTYHLQKSFTEIEPWMKPQEQYKVTSKPYSPGFTIEFENPNIKVDEFDLTSFQCATVSGDRAAVISSNIKTFATIINGDVKSWQIKTDDVWEVPVFVSAAFYHEYLVLVDTNQVVVALNTETGEYRNYLISNVVSVASDDIYLYLGDYTGIIYRFTLDDELLWHGATLTCTVPLLLAASEGRVFYAFNETELYLVDGKYAAKYDGTEPYPFPKLQ